MSDPKYLDGNGVSHLWKKIVDKDKTDMESIGIEYDEPRRKLILSTNDRKYRNAEVDMLPFTSEVEVNDGEIPIIESAEIWVDRSKNSELIVPEAPDDKIYGRTRGSWKDISISINSIDNKVPGYLGGDHDFNGKGRVNLLKNMVKQSDGRIINILTQDVFDRPDTIYIIQYDFDLQNQIIELPNNCVLKFNGGSLSHGTIKANYGYIDAENEYVFKKLKLKGSFYNDCLKAAWFGVNTNNEDNSDYITAALESCYNINLKILQFHAGIFNVNKIIDISKAQDAKINVRAQWDIVIKGSGSGATGTVFNMGPDAMFIVDQTNDNFGSPRSGAIMDCRFSGSNKTGAGIKLVFSQTFSIQRCFFVSLEHSIIITGHSYFTNIESCTFEYCKYGVYVPNKSDKKYWVDGGGNNNYIHYCQFTYQDHPIQLNEGNGWGIYDSDIENNNGTTYLGNKNSIYNCRFETNKQNKEKCYWIECESYCTIKECQFYTIGGDTTWRIFIHGDNNYINVYFGLFNPLAICSLGINNIFKIDTNQAPQILTYPMEFIVDPNDTFILNGSSNKDNRIGINYIDNFSDFGNDIMNYKDPVYFKNEECGKLQLKTQLQGIFHLSKPHRSGVFSFNIYNYNSKNSEEMTELGALEFGTDKSLYFYTPNKDKWFTFICPTMRASENIGDAKGWGRLFRINPPNNPSIINICFSDRLLTNMPILKTSINLPNNADDLNVIDLPSNISVVKEEKLCKRYYSNIYKNGLDKTIKLIDDTKYDDYINVSNNRHVRGFNNRDDIRCDGYVSDFAYGQVIFKSKTTNRYGIFNFKRDEKIEGKINEYRYSYYKVAASDPAIDFSLNEKGTINWLGFNEKSQGYDQSKPEDIVYGYIEGIKFEDIKNITIPDEFLYVYLNKNESEGKYILTNDMIGFINTIYIIKYDFDLSGGTFNIPKGCTLRFEGGSLNNGNLYLNDTKLEGNIKFNNINPVSNPDIGINSTIKGNYINVEWFNLSKQNDGSHLLFSLMDLLANAGGGTLYFPSGTYKILHLNINTKKYNNISFIGENRENTIIKQLLPKDGKKLVGEWKIPTYSRYDIADGCFVFDAHAYAIDDSKSIKNITIDNLSFVNNTNVNKKDYDEIFHLMVLHGVSNFTIKNCNFIGFLGDGICVTNGLDNDTTSHNYNKNIKIYNCNFDGINNETGAGININYCNTWEIRNCSFKNISKSTTYGAIVLRLADANYGQAGFNNVDTRNGIIESCIFDNIWGYGSIYFKIENWIKYSHAYSFTNYRITNCNFNNIHSPLYVTSNENDYIDYNGNYNIEFFNNNAKDIDQPLSLSFTSGVYVHDCRFINMESAYALLNGCKLIRIEHCLFKNSSKVDYDGVIFDAISPMEDIDFIGNTVDNCGQYGLYLTHSQGLRYFYDNMFVNSGSSNADIFYMQMLFANGEDLKNLKMYNNKHDNSFVDTNIYKYAYYNQSENIKSFLVVNISDYLLKLGLDDTKTSYIQVGDRISLTYNGTSYTANVIDIEFSEDGVTEQDPYSEIGLYTLDEVIPREWIGKNINIEIIKKDIMEYLIPYHAIPGITEFNCSNYVLDNGIQLSGHIKMIRNNFYNPNNIDDPFNSSDPNLLKQAPVYQYFYPSNNENKIFFRQAINKNKWHNWKELASGGGVAGSVDGGNAFKN